MIRKFRKPPRRMYESADFELSLEDIGDLTQEVFMRSDELAMPDDNNGFIRLLNNDMIRKLTNLGFDIDFERQCLRINNVYEDDWKESILLLNLKKAEHGWYEDDDTGLFLRYNKSEEYLEIGYDSTFDAIDIDIYSNWEAIASYMEKRIAKDDLDDYADEDGNPAFWCILDRHLDEFENAVLDYAELNPRFINKLKQIRKRF